MPEGQLLQQVHQTNDLITWVFIVELSLRFLVAPSKRIFFSNYWIDILSVLPVLRIFRTLRIIRLLRLLRLVRAAIIVLKKSGWLSNRLNSMFGSFGVLFLLACLFILCGTIAFITFDPISGATFDDKLNALLNKIWLTLFLFTSGEVVGEIPSSISAKIVAILITISGLVIFAVMVGTVTASMTAFIQKKMDQKDLNINDLENHIIICGWDRMGSVIVRELETSKDLWKRGVVVISESENDLAHESKIKNTSRFFHVKEDFTKFDVLEKVGVKKAKTAIVLADPGNGLNDQDRDARTVLAALTIEKLNPSIFTCAELLDDQNATHLQIAGVEEILSRNQVTAGLFAATAINSGVSSFIREILSHHEGNYLTKTALPEDMANKTFLEVFSYYKEHYDATVVGVQNQSDGYETHINPAPDTILKSSDQLTLIIKRDSDISALNS